MKRRTMLIVTVCVVLAAGVFGVVKRQTYTDITKEENYLDKLQVALFPEDMLENTCKIMEKNVEDAPIIFKGEPSGEIEHLFQTGRQKMKVVQVYKGDTIKSGDEIYVYSERWQLCLGEEPESVERGFINVMKEGKEYLVFLSKQMEEHYLDIPVYKTYQPGDMDENKGEVGTASYEDFMIAPVFCYENMEHNIPTLVNDENTYVPYSEVRDNEFFGMNENSYVLWEQLKERVLEKYKLSIN